ncbi:MAG: hypothetical protein ACYC96_09805 [Fimbriimonadaceae bacterium]
MARKRKGKVVVGEKSPEYTEFETFARQVLSVPKAELDRREAESKRAKQEKQSPPVS